ncbi:MAG TPA: type II 3-dehydroquinate dehydratase [Desulfomonilia bacterium]|nr:type II 3-dehydroquinate dehydratase [Desulfomonilia bacterium]
MKILIINGPNMNMLGRRETSIYGPTSLDDIEGLVRRKALSIGAEVDFFQSNHEGELIDRIHKAQSLGIDAFIINPGGLTHTSVSLRDALLAVGVPFIEVHLSKVSSRESFRLINYFSDIAAGTIAGFGPLGYELAVEAVWGLYGKKAQ